MRAKLIELIKEARDIGDRHCEEMGSCDRCHELGYDIDNCGEIATADYLIENGVTFAEDNNVPTKWIPTEEQMPEFYMNEHGRLCTNGKIVFRCTLDKTVHLGYCIKRTLVGAKGEFYLFYWYDYHGGKWENVSHWMQLPELPKEVSP